MAPPFPPSLLSWMDERTLALLVLAAQSETASTAGTIFEFPPTGFGVRPQVVLTLLVYCYAAGILPTDEIHRLMEERCMVRYLCAKAFPEPGTLRYFRRHHRPLIHECLAAVFAKAWARQAGLPELDRSQNERVRKACARAAGERIEYAVQLDSMALDC